MLLSFKSINQNTNSTQEPQVRSHSQLVTQAQVKQIKFKSNAETKGKSEH